jgi:hypothetical protein
MTNVSCENIKTLLVQKLTKYFGQGYKCHDTILVNSKVRYRKITFFFFSLTWVSGPVCAHLD